MPPDAGYRIEPFEPRLHDRAGFRCGNRRIDNYLHLSARKHRENRFTRLHVAVRPGERAVLGFHALTASELAPAGLPDPPLRHAPRYSGATAPLPVIMLSMMGVTASEQGRGLGRLLLADALQRCAAASALVGVKPVLLDAVDERAKRLYRTLGFAELSSVPDRMYLPVQDIVASQP